MNIFLDKLNSNDCKKNQKMNKRDFFLGFLCFLPTLVNVPVAYVYLMISCIGLLFLLMSFSKKNFFKGDYFLIFIFIISLFIFFIGLTQDIGNQGKSLNNYIPYTFFIVTTIFFSRYINRGVIIVILNLIAIEVIVGLLELFSGVPYFIQPTAIKETNFGVNEFLYNDRVYGLSSSTSIFALKAFGGILLLYFTKIKRFKNLYLILLLSGLFISFNRTAMISIVFFFCLNTLVTFRKVKLWKKLSLFFIVFLIIYLVFQYLDVILFQFFRGSDEVDLSERDIIFPRYLNFIKENLFFGNFVNKYWIEMDNRIFHAHNSYLQTLSSIGGILSILFVIYFCKVINRKVMVYLLPILLYSSFQFGIFWGVSFLDIVFFYIIFNKEGIISDNNIETREKLKIE